MKIIPITACTNVPTILGAIRDESMGQKSADIRARHHGNTIAAIDVNHDECNTDRAANMILRAFDCQVRGAPWATSQMVRAARVARRLLGFIVRDNSEPTEVLTFSNRRTSDVHAKLRRPHESRFVKELTDGD
jgi:hypothetical protein